MPAAGDADGVRIGDDGHDVVVLFRKRRKGAEHVRLRERGGVALNAAERLGHAFAHLAEQLVFEPGKLLGSAHDLVFEFLEFSGDIPFAVRQGLLADIALRRHADIGFRDLYVIAENLVVAYFQVLDPGGVPLLAFHLGNHAAGVVEQAAQPVHLLVVAVPDQAQFAHGKRAVFGNGGQNMPGQRVQRVQRAVEGAQVL